MVKIENAVNKTLEDIVEEGNKLFRDISALVDQGKNPDEIGKATFTAHKDFITTYPIVIQYMLTKTYDKGVFSKWLMKLTKKPWLSETDFFESQAQYAAMLMKKLHPECNNTQIAEFRREVNKTLVDDRKAFKDNIDRAQKIVEEREKAVLEDRKKDLVELLKTGKINEMQYKADLMTAMPTSDEKKKALLDYIRDHPIV